jgi:hypothetical protein
MAASALVQQLLLVCAGRLPLGTLVVLLVVSMQVLV